MSQRQSKDNAPGSLGRLIGVLYSVVGAVGLLVLLVARRPQGFEAFNQPLVIVGMAVLFLVLVIIGLIMAVPKPDPKSKFLR